MRCRVHRFPPLKKPRTGHPIFWLWNGDQNLERVGHPPIPDKGCPILAFFARVGIDKADSDVLFRFENVTLRSGFVNSVVSAFSIPTLSQSARKNGAPLVWIGSVRSKAGPPAGSTCRSCSWSARRSGLTKEGFDS